MWKTINNSKLENKLHLSNNFIIVNFISKHEINQRKFNRLIKIIIFHT